MRKRWRAILLALRGAGGLRIQGNKGIMSLNIIRRTIGLLTVLAVGAAAGLLGTGAASAATTSHGPSAPRYRVIPASTVVWDFRNAHTGLCLDDSSFGLRAISCNGLDFQDWAVGSS